MSCIHVTTQTELDAALELDQPGRCIHVDGDCEFEISSSGSATVRAYGSATVSASGSATVSASGSATVRAYGSATVRAYGSATVSAYGSATVRAYDSATVSAYDSATVSAYDSATVSASKYVAIHKHSKYAKVNGGVLIEPVKMNDPTAAEWAEYYGLDVVDGIVTVYKGVNDQCTTSHGADYSPGATPEAADWKPTNECGNGLHFSPSPGHTFGYNADATRFLACPVKLAEVIVLGDKVKAPRVEEPGCVEVDLVGRPIVRNESTAKK